MKLGSNRALRVQNSESAVESSSYSSGVTAPLAVASEQLTRVRACGMLLFAAGTRECNEEDDIDGASTLTIDTGSSSSSIVVAVALQHAYDENQLQLELLTHLGLLPSDLCLVDVPSCQSHRLIPVCMPGARHGTELTPASTQRSIDHTYALDPA